MSKKKKITRTRAVSDFSNWTFKDNIPEGGRLEVPASLIMRFFGEEIQKRFIIGGKYTHLQKQQEVQQNTVQQDIDEINSSTNSDEHET